MKRFLAVDIGAGTMDILYYEHPSGVHYKAVVKSPVQALAERASAIEGNLLITGVEMGGGAISSVLKERAQTAEVVMSRTSAATVHHDPERVRSRGIRVVEDGEAEELKKTRRYIHLELADLDIERLRPIIEGFGVPFSFDVLCVCAQDHGVAPEGMSHLDYRHNLFARSLNDDPLPHSLLYRRDEVPATFNRLKAIADSSMSFPSHEIFVMDSGMAAILGATLDPLANAKKRVLVVDAATSHTVGAAVEEGGIAGFFEYHTHDITLGRLEELLAGLSEGTLNHEKVLQEGGHGAFVRGHFGFRNAEILVATGPKRGIVRGSSFPFVLGAPMGDNMMTGTAGLLEAVFRRKGLGEIESV
ncbi:MAG: DUF1786 family protein [Pseudomonadota bacterium]